MLLKRCFLSSSYAYEYPVQINTNVIWSPFDISEPVDQPVDDRSTLMLVSDAMFVEAVALERSQRCKGGSHNCIDSRFCRLMMVESA